MGDLLEQLLGDPDFNDIRMGIPAVPDHIPESWFGPHPAEFQMYTTERTQFAMNRHWAQLTLASRPSDYSNVIPPTGPIVGGATLTHRTQPPQNHGPLEFGDDCRVVRPRCPTCTELDSLSFAGMESIVHVTQERREIMLQHLRNRVLHYGWQAARADKLAFNWHREGNNAYLFLHHFNMAHSEAKRQDQQQPPIQPPQAPAQPTAPEPIPPPNQPPDQPPETGHTAPGTHCQKGLSVLTGRLTYQCGGDRESLEEYPSTSTDTTTAAQTAVTVTKIDVQQTGATPNDPAQQGPHTRRTPENAKGRPRATTRPDYHLRPCQTTKGGTFISLTQIGMRKRKGRDRSVKAINNPTEPICKHQLGIPQYQ